MRFRVDRRIASPDRAGRLRGYLKVGGRDVGARLVAAGLAVRRPGPAFGRGSQYRKVARSARAHRRGAWRCG
jgi:endonuclease YncB( thermonuclease family)